MTEIRPYDFDRETSARFLRLRADLRRGPSDVDAFAQQPWFEPTHAFYGRPGNRHRHFAAFDGERLVGHVSAFVNQDLAETDGTPVGTLGMFECVDDEPVARALLDAGLAWLDDAGRGACVWAPVDFDIWHGYRFRTRGFDAPTFPGEPLNPERYAGLFERHGFAARERWTTVEVAGAEALARLAATLEPRHRDRLADGYRFATLDAAADLETLYRLVLDSFAGFLGFTRPTFAEFRELYGPLWRSVDLRLGNLALDPAGTPVGFTLAYPRGDRVILYMIGITQAELAKRHGLGRAAGHDCLRRIAAAGHTLVVFALLSRESGARALLGPHADDARSEYALFRRRHR